MAECPTCNGSGEVPEHIADALLESKKSRGGICHCDGPPHVYAPSWCPKTGPVTR